MIKRAGLVRVWAVLGQAWKPLLGLPVLGALTVLGFAPFYLYPLPWLAMAVLWAVMAPVTRRRVGAAYGFLFGFGFFAAGISWVFISLHRYGEMPLLPALLSTLALVAALALYPALWGYAVSRMPVGWARWWAMPAAWVLMEWLKGRLMTGFDWLALGYSQAVAGNPLSGFAPVLGEYGLAWVALLLASALGLALRPLPGRAAGPQRLWAASFGVLLLGGGWVLNQLQWVQPQGAPLAVSLAQGNIPQDQKWVPEALPLSIRRYNVLAHVSQGRLVVMPETALPLFLDDMPMGLWQQWQQLAQQRGGLLFGVGARTGADRYYNAVVGLSADKAFQFYYKEHLVPFGEYMPLRPLLQWWFEWVNIPLLDFHRGSEAPRPMRMLGQQLAVNVCYEDGFNHEILRQLPQASILVNVSNLAWFSGSHALMQHLQMSQLRSMETGRPMLRATNTGMTAIIDHRGRVLQVLPSDRVGLLEGQVQGMQGQTPFVRWGNGPVLALSLALLLGCWRWRPRPA